VTSLPQFAASLLAAALFVAAGPAAPEDAIRGQYAALRAAIAANDGEAIRSILTGDFVGCNADGTIQDVAGFITATAQAASAGTSVVVTIDARSIAIGGATAVADAQYGLNMMAVRDAKPVHVVAVSKDTDRWVSTGGQWRLSRQVETDSTLMVDGAVATHYASPRHQCGS
jgi:hypothetical protein